MDDNTAAQRLRLLRAEFVQPGNHGPGDGRSATLTAGAAPLHLGILDHLTNAVNEVVEHTMAAAPGAEPAPRDETRIYDWSRQNTAHLDTERQQAREALIYRQGLEHAITLGDTKVVRPHRCPACRCYGLQWYRAEQRAVCTNTRCTDKEGLANRWTLARLAAQHIATQKNRAARAT